MKISEVVCTPNEQGDHRSCVVLHGGITVRPARARGLHIGFSIVFKVNDGLAS
jgi:hypothetical protein